jgi:hypothetical protein
VDLVVDWAGSGARGSEEKGDWGGGESVLRVCLN